MLEIAIAQTAPTFLDMEHNHAAAIELIRATDADLVLLPELYLTGYAFSTAEQLKRVALGRKNRYFDELCRVSQERDVAICGGYAERGGETERGVAVYNSSFFIGDGRLIAHYRKLHLFYRETQFFTPGSDGFSVFEYRGARFGMMVCFDWIFPEAARTLALLGAQVILHPANLVLPYFQRAAFARAVENRVFVASANRVGNEKNQFGDDLTFTGGSQVVSPTGEYLLAFNATEAGVRSISIDPRQADEKQLNEFNTILADRRPEFYLQDPAGR